MAMMEARKLPDGCTLVTYPDCPGYGLIIPLHGLYIPVAIDGLKFEPFRLSIKHGYGDPPETPYIRVVPSQEAGHHLFITMTALREAQEHGEDA